MPMPDEPSTDEPNRVRVLEWGIEATLWRPKSTPNCEDCSDFDPDEPMPSGTYTLEVMATGERLRFVIQHDGDTYELTSL